MNYAWFIFLFLIIIIFVHSDSISLLLTSGVKVTMITGDAQPTAEAIAEKLGFFDRNVHVSLSGAEIDAMSDYDLQSKIEATRVFYRTRLG